MKILHTSDLHLREYEDDRWKTLLKLLEIGKQNDIEILAISGDLFDNNIIAEELRPKLRSIFSQNKFKIVIIPGNHDKDSYKSGKYFGDDVVIIQDLNSPFELENIRIWGMPFELIDRETILENLQKLKEKLNSDKPNILLFHGELLDTFFSRIDFGEEGEDRYMPIKLSYFKDLNFNYILGGHFHSKFDIWQIDRENFFVYSGSPISITKREIGKRKVNLFELGKPPIEYPLDTPYFEKVKIELDPIKDFDPIKVVQNSLNKLPSYAKISLTISGYLNNVVIGMNETKLKEKISEIIPENCIEVDYAFKDISEITEDYLFIKFLKKLSERDYSEEKIKKMKELTIKSMRWMKL